MVFDIDSSSSSLDLGHSIQPIHFILDPKNGLHNFSRIPANQPDSNLHDASQIQPRNDCKILLRHRSPYLLRTRQLHVPKAIKQRRKIPLSVQNAKRVHLSLRGYWRSPAKEHPTGHIILGENELEAGGVEEGGSDT